MTATTHTKPRVLLLSPGIIKWTDADFGLPHLVSLGGYLEQQLPVEAVLLDLAYEACDQAQLARTLDELGPFLLVGLSCYSSFDYLRCVTLAAFIRRCCGEATTIVAGGYHATARPDDLLAAGSAVDAVICGEGEAGLRRVTEELLGDGTLSSQIYRDAPIADLDKLPPYRWDLLDRYWPRAHTLGRKLQIYFSRGCPHHCTFCMERAKGDYGWRGLSAERAVEELQRLARLTDLSRWVVNVADPLFGFSRTWRREVLEGIIRHGLLPRQYWTLTRCEDLQDQDVSLLARARFSIGIGVESGDPQMLQVMNKTRQPERYLDALLRLARLARQHRLSWAGNVIVGHPGETVDSMRRSHSFLTELFSSAEQTCGWLSVDPFRLYPGSDVAERLDHYSETYGARFYHPRWWHSWYDGSFRAEHIDPSPELSYAQRVSLMVELYRPLLGRISDRFAGQGRSIDRVFERSIAEQSEQMSDASRDRLLQHDRISAAAAACNDAENFAQCAKSRDDSRSESRARMVREDNKPALTFPIGLQVRDPAVRQREAAVRRLLEGSILRDERHIEALLATPPEPYLGAAQTARMLADKLPESLAEGAAPPYLGVSTIALALAALDPGPGDRVADLLANNGYVAALLSCLVGAEGEVVVAMPAAKRSAIRALKRSLADLPSRSTASAGKATTARGIEGAFDGIWLGACLPRRPEHLVAALRNPGGKLLTLVGPRFRAADLVCLTRSGDSASERIIARVVAPIVAGPHGWIREVRS